MNGIVELYQKTKEEEKNIITIKDKDEKIIHAIIEIH